MRIRHHLLTSLWLVLAFFSGHSRAAEAPLPPATIVVYNRDLPESAELARFYAQQRGIARDHVVGLSCSKDEEISREDYDRTIAEPLRTIFKERKWWTLHQSPEGRSSVASNTIRFVALIKGMPLKIRNATGYPEDKPRETPISDRNEASVDSELSILGLFSRQISGAINNPYFQSYRPIAQFENSAILLVCRLDAPSVATVRRMILDAIEAEKKGLWGRAYIDGAHNTSVGLGVGDLWLAEIRDQLHRVGIPVVYEDTPALFPDGFPMSDCALYYGWYAGSVTGPFAQPLFQFVPGAVAVHIHSFSASTLRDPNANWVGPLLTHGAAVTLGNVYEPFLQMTAHLNVFNDRLLHGFTFAESAYMSVPALSWMSVMVGDPLYRPYATWLQLEGKREPDRNASDWKNYHEFATQNGSRPAPELRALARPVAVRAQNGAMLEDLGLMETQDGNLAAAYGYFEQARAIYTKRDDLVRVVLEEVDVLAKQRKSKRALELVRSVLRVVTDAPMTTLLRKIENDLRSASSTPPPKR